MYLYIQLPRLLLKNLNSLKKSDDRFSKNRGMYIFFRTSTFSYRKIQLISNSYLHKILEWITLIFLDSIKLWYLTFGKWNFAFIFGWFWHLDQFVWLHQYTMMSIKMQIMAMQIKKFCSTAQQRVAQIQMQHASSLSNLKTSHITNAQRLAMMRVTLPLGVPHWLMIPEHI